MQNLKIAALQIDIIPNNAIANCANIEEQIWEMDQKIDLIILPELFNVGFHFDKNSIEPANFTTFKWMKRMSTIAQATIFGSILEKDSIHVYNRAYAIHPDGSYQSYDKRHLFIKSDEPLICTPGSTQVTFDIKGWKIHPTICFDLRFPVWCRNINKADVLLNIANWPSKRVDVFTTLLKSRAIENQTYTIGVNRIGSDLSGGLYNGNSSIYNFKGEIINQPNSKEQTVIFELDKEELLAFRNNNPYLDLQDSFTIN